MRSRGDSVRVQLIAIATMICVILIVLIGWLSVRSKGQTNGNQKPASTATPLESQLTSFQRKQMAELKRQVKAGIRYDDGYYTGGDPPAAIGVCTDVLCRAFRAAGADLKGAVTRDIREHTDRYPLSHPDPNIDHRRCRNLIVFFQRHARSLPTEGREADWRPGDLVFWSTFGTKADHCGMIGEGVGQSGNPIVVHHWPGHPVEEMDGLHTWKIRYHFRWAH